MHSRSPVLEQLIAGFQPTVHGGAVQVGTLHDRVLGSLPVCTTARSVWIKPGTLEHIESRRRKHVAPGSDERAVEQDVIFVLRHMAAVIARPRYWGVHPGDAGKFALVDMIEEDARYLHVAIKFVWPPKSHTGGDEIWVTTGWPMGYASLRRDLKRGRLVPVSGG